MGQPGHRGRAHASGCRLEPDSWPIWQIVSVSANLPKNLSATCPARSRHLPGPVQDDGPDGELLPTNFGAGLDITAPSQGFQQILRQPLLLQSWSDCGLRGPHCLGGIANELVQDHGHSLAQVHGAVVFASRDAHDPVTMTELTVEQTEPFGAKKKSDSSRSQSLMNRLGALLKALDGMLEVAIVGGRCADD